MSAEQKPMVMVRSVRLGEFAVCELSRLLRVAANYKDEPLQVEFLQLHSALRALEHTGRTVELRVVPDDEDMEGGTP